MPHYLRYPHLHGDLVTFVAADDVWLAPVPGGRAWRLTDDRAPVENGKRKQCHDGALDITQGSEDRKSVV